MCTETDSVSRMREMRQVSSAIYKKFTEAHNFFETHAFCFYEGEDGKYYNSRIEQYWHDSFITLPAGNKKEVLRVMQKITSDPLYNNVCVMFFVDRDYDTTLKDSNEHLFETPCYSIESLYVQEQALDKILRAEFGLSVTDADFHKCKEVFRLRFAEFNQVILQFNALAKYKHQYCPNNTCRLSDTKTSHLANISLNGVVKSSQYQTKIDSLIAKLNADHTLLEEIETNLKNEPNKISVFRGKNQLDFLVSMLEKFKAANSQGGFFSEPLHHVHINITGNRLSELSQYAVTPPELTEFLLQHSPTRCTPV